MNFIKTQKAMKILEKIQTAKACGNLALFIGAGFSMCENPRKYKSWDGVTKKLIDELKCDKNLGNLKISELYKLEFGKEKLKEAVMSSFPKTDEAGELHKALVSLNPHYIITTNWDKLIDDAILNSTNIFDIIVSDSELSCSINNSKYIKMHGDFEHANFVYTESDYLHYSENFPLIENFLKSIFSTHVTVLLGYSFNDIDLKQIIGWVKNHSEERLPIYMITTSPKNTAELSYLGSYGIQILEICKTNKNSKSAFIDLFKRFDASNPINYKNTPCEYIYNKIKHLEEYPVILQTQIIDLLSNSNIEYPIDDKAFLCFYDNVASYDDNDEVRNIYRTFLKNAIKYNNNSNPQHDLLEKIIIILKKADIHGLCNDRLIRTRTVMTFDIKGSPDLYDNYSPRFSFDYKTQKVETFKEMQDLVFSYYSKAQYEKAFEITSELIFKSKKEGKFTDTFVSFFNYNILLKRLKFADPKIRTKYLSIDLIDIEKEYAKLPDREKETVYPIYSFVNFSKINDMYMNVQTRIEKVRIHKKILKESGLSGIEYDGHRLIHKNLVDFVVNNGICIEDFTEYKKTCEKFLVLSQEDLQDESKWQPNKTELYSCIKYFDFKQCQEFLEAFKNKEKCLVITNELLEWLIKDVLKNCSTNYINKLNPFTNLERYIANTLFVLSLTALNNKQINAITRQIVRVLQKVRNNLNVFESIELFFTNQFVLYKEQALLDKNAMLVFETILEKLADDKCNGYEIESLCRYKLINVCNIAVNNGFKFNNIELLKKLLQGINEMQYAEEKYRFIDCIVLIIYQMADDCCKKETESFLLNLKYDDNEKGVEFIKLQLALKKLGFKIDDVQLIRLLNEQVNSMSENMFSSLFYELQQSVKKICEMDGYYSDLLNKLDERIRKYEEGKIRVK